MAHEHYSSREPLCLEDSYEPSSKPRKKRKYIRYGTAAVAGILTVQNIDTAQMAYSFFLGGGDMPPTVSGCEYQPPLVTIPSTLTTIVPETTTTTSSPTTETEPTTTVAQPNDEDDVKDVRSAADNNSYLQMLMNQPEFWRQKKEMYKYPDIRFTSQISGIEFDIYRTKEQPMRTIDPNAFDELFHMALTTDIDIGSPRIEHLMSCMRRRILDNKELAGRTVRIIIPSTPDYCISNTILIRVHDRAQNECTQTGAALPRVNLDAFFWKPYDEELFFLTMGDVDGSSPEAINERFQQYVFHEATHWFFYEMGIEPRKHPDEQFTKYIERKIIAKANTPILYGPPYNPAGYSVPMFSLRGSTTTEFKIPTAITYTGIDG